MASLFSLIRSAAKSLNGVSLYSHQIIRKSSHISSPGVRTASVARGVSVLTLQAPRQKRLTQIQFFTRDILKVSHNTNINVKKV
jgi:hypothetical protein